ncbi:glycine betaine ABC transporter substrate-binding protein [Alteribacter aurantiacus]|uniref:glycine betaine ABC transporter substrate-binding protein n=1 Tax=Alteribacter aurantiacus TaxID=254410 RepID=UPI00041210CE|nr:glycine betaine ABC transporter substrate-binding protein [Alteribacter aurantiacus]
MKKHKGLLLFSLGLMVALSACGGDGGTTEDDGDVGTDGGVEESTEEKGEIVIGRNNWAENIAVSNMWKILLEEEGYEVDIQSMDKAPVWLGISRGELDIAPEVWLPNTDESYNDQYGDDLDMREMWYEGTELGFAVPEYMDIDSIEELNDMADEFDGQIVGIEEGAALTDLARDAIDEYDLDLDLVTSSDPAMNAEFMQAYNNEEPIVVTLWSPHWLFADYDIKYLEDPKNVFGDPDDIYYMTREGFAEDHPEVVEWMDNWMMDDESLGDLMATINDLDDPYEGAKEWIEENRDMVDEWMAE